jgi:hypothetical protein
MGTKKGQKYLTLMLIASNEQLGKYPAALSKETVGILKPAGLNPVEIPVEERPYCDDKKADKRKEKKGEPEYLNDTEKK